MAFLSRLSRTRETICPDVGDDIIVRMPQFTRASYLGFAAFGLFGARGGAALPVLREQASLDDAQLGVALVFVGVGALPAMLLSGRAVDRWGHRVAGFVLIGVGVAAALVGIFAHDALPASPAMLALGATSGAADVAINSLAGFAETKSVSRVITRSHAVFSAFVVAGSITAGAFHSLGTTTPVIFASVAIVIAAAGVTVAVILGASSTIKTGSAPASRPTADVRWLMPFVLVGLVGGAVIACGGTVLVAASHTVIVALAVWLLPRSEPRSCSPHS